VLSHSGQQTGGYAVLTSLGAVGCQVQVADEGIGVPRDRATPGDPQEIPLAQLPESGRGLAVMRACVDNVELDSRPGHGTVVTMRKRIQWEVPSSLASGAA
jgi:anti-sigma regulatory factor (Ser/Thr protein kinase)